MVYSTCSLSVEQNEAVVSHLLHTQPSARLDPIHWAPGGDTQGKHTGTHKGPLEWRTLRSLSEALPV